MDDFDHFGLDGRAALFNNPRWRTSARALEGGGEERILKSCFYCETKKAMGKCLILAKFEAGGAGVWITFAMIQPRRLAKTKRGGWVMVDEKEKSACP